MASHEGGKNAGYLTSWKRAGLRRSEEARGGVNARPLAGLRIDRNEQRRRALALVQRVPHARKLVDRHTWS